MADRAPAGGDSPPQVSRARQFREILGELGLVRGVRGGMIVTPDGFVITADLPATVDSAEGLAALAATLGRELELGMDELAGGPFQTAFFAAEDGAVFLGGSAIGFVILLGDASAKPEAVAPALDRALARLEGAWRV